MPRRPVFLLLLPPLLLPLLLLLLPLLLAACRDHGAAPQPRTVTIPTASGSGEARNPAPAPPAAPTLACGSTSCRPADEACCAYGDKTVCAPRARPAPEEVYWARQMESCNAVAHAEYSLSSISTCDDSGDCGSGTCCSEALGSDVGLDVCAAEPACSYGELCAGAATCKTPGTTCIEGRCRKGPVRSCAGHACTAEAPLCCGPFGTDPPSCATAASCSAQDRTAQYECEGPEDCAPGQSCFSFIAGTRCQGLFDSANTAYVCHKDADCPADMCAIYSGGPPKCTPDPDPDRPWRHLSTCQCP